MDAANLDKIAKIREKPIESLGSFCPKYFSKIVRDSYFFVWNLTVQNPFQLKFKVKNMAKFMKYILKCQN